MNYLTNLKPLDIPVRGFVRLFPWKDWLLLRFEDAVAQLLLLRRARFTSYNTDSEVTDSQQPLLTVISVKIGHLGESYGGKKVNASFVVLEAVSRPWSVWVPGGSGEVMMCNSPWGIPSGFARRDAGRPGGRRTSPATLSLLFGNLLDFVSAENKKRGKNVKLW